MVERKMGPHHPRHRDLGHQPATTDGAYRGGEDRRTRLRAVGRGGVCLGGVTVNVIAPALVDAPILGNFTDEALKGVQPQGTDWADRASIQPVIV